MFDPGKPKNLIKELPGDRFENILDLRDSIANLIGSNYSGPMNEDIKKDYAYLATKLGKGTADKIMTRIYMQNTDPFNQRRSLTERINSFYSTPASDDDLRGLFDTIRTFGKGPVAGLNESVNYGNMMLSGRDPGGRTIAGNIPGKVRNINF